MLCFVVRVQDVAAVLSAAEDKGEGAFSQPRITLASDGEVHVRWMTQSGKWREVVITRADAA
jgi:hypothetical protein